MDSFSLHPTYFGKNLDEAIDTVYPERQPIIENFLYEKSALLLYADDGVGKSSLALQACLQATVADSKVFGSFSVSTPAKILYFQMERHPDESFERMRHLRSVIPFDSSKFALSVALQGTNLQDPSMRRDSLSKVEAVIKEIGFMPNVVAFDPIYALVPDDLASAPPCNAITSFFRVIQLATNCTILATSHTNRGVRDRETNLRTAKDMYGNRFLSAFFTASYHIEGKPNGEGTIFKLDKNSQKNMERRFGLNYDASCYRSWTDEDGLLSKRDKLDNFLMVCKQTKKEFSFADMQAISDLSDSALRGHLSGYLKAIVKESSKLSRGKILYRVE